jgi:hypothetical protein
MPHCELWQAVCLSLDFEPPNRLDLVKFLDVPHTTFNNRMKVCIANLGGKLSVVDPRTAFIYREAALVDIAIFAAVTESWAWDIPQALQGRAQHNSAPPTAPAATPQKPTATPKNRKPRASWRDKMPYIAEVYNQTTQAGAIGLWRNLKMKAGSEPSPFVLGTGPDSAKLVVKSSRATLALHTLETNMKTIREMAAEKAAQQK